MTSICLLKLGYKWWHSDTISPWLCLSWELCLWSPKLLCKKYINIKAAIVKKTDKESTWGRERCLATPSCSSPWWLNPVKSSAIHVSEWAFSWLQPPAFQPPKLTLSIRKCVTSIRFCPKCRYVGKYKFFIFILNDWVLVSKMECC